MEKRLVLVIQPTSYGTRLLMTAGTDEVLRAELPIPLQADHRAAATLIEGLALWYQRPVSVVLCADAAATSSALCLCDGFGFGKTGLHFTVQVRERGRRRAGRRLAGPGRFGELRALCLGGAA